MPPGWVRINFPPEFRNVRGLAERSGWHLRDDGAGVLVCTNETYEKVAPRLVRRRCRARGVQARAGAIRAVRGGSRPLVQRAARLRALLASWSPRAVTVVARADDGPTRRRDRVLVRRSGPRHAERASR